MVFLWCSSKWTETGVRMNIQLRSHIILSQEKKALKKSILGKDPGEMNNSKARSRPLNISY